MGTSEVAAKKGCRSPSYQEKQWAASWWSEQAQHGAKERFGARAQSKSVAETRGEPQADESWGVQATPPTAPGSPFPLHSLSCIRGCLSVTTPASGRFQDEA